MKVCVLASGSKGNVTYVEANNKKILLDAGKNYKYIKDRLKEINVDIKDINYILISHNHTDHISALKSLVAKTKATIIISMQLLYEIDDLKDYDNILTIDNELEVDDLLITSIHSSHDAIDSRNFIIDDGENKLAYVTDTGYVNNKYFNLLKNLDIYLFESNHDVELLQHGPYPDWLKRRVLGDNGHLSNKSSSFYLSKLIGDKTKKIVLIHLSEINNLESIALETINNTFMDYGINFNNIICARQNEKTEVIEV